MTAAARDDAVTAISAILDAHTPTLVGSRYMCRCEHIGLVEWDAHRDHLARVLASDMAGAQAKAFTALADRWEAEMPLFPLADGTFAGAPFWVVELRATIADPSYPFTADTGNTE